MSGSYYNNNDAKTPLLEEGSGNFHTKEENYESAKESVKQSYNVVRILSLLGQTAMAFMTLIIYGKTLATYKRNTYYMGKGVVDLGSNNTVDILIDTSRLSGFDRHQMMAGYAVGLTPETNDNLTSTHVCYNRNGQHGSTYFKEQILYAWYTFEQAPLNGTYIGASVYYNESLVRKQEGAFDHAHDNGWLIVIGVALGVTGWAWIQGTYYQAFRMKEIKETWPSCDYFALYLLLAVLPFICTCLLIPLNSFVYNDGICLHSIDDIFFSYIGLLTLFEISGIFMCTCISGLAFVYCCPQLMSSEGDSNKEKKRKQRKWFRCWVGIIVIGLFVQGVIGLTIATYQDHYYNLPAYIYTAMTVIHWMQSCGF